MLGASSRRARRERNRRAVSGQTVVATSSSAPRLMPSPPVAPFSEMCARTLRFRDESVRICICISVRVCMCVCVAMAFNRLRHTSRRSSHILTHARAYTYAHTQMLYTSAGKTGSSATHKHCGSVNMRNIKCTIFCASCCAICRSKVLC